MGNSGRPRDRFSCFRVCETEQCTFLFCIDVKVVLSPPPPPPETQILRLGLSSPLIHMGSLGFLARPPRILNREAVPVGDCCHVPAPLLSTPLKSHRKGGLACRALIYTPPSRRRPERLLRYANFRRSGEEKKLMRYLFRGHWGSCLVFKEHLLPRYFRTGCCEPFGVPSM